MTTTDHVFAANRPRVISESIDGEVIMIDLVTGSYYSLNSTGAEIWDCFDEPRAVGHVAAAISGRYPNGSARELDEAINTFIAELAAAELIVPTADDAGRPLPSSPNGSTFVTPELTAYTDMQDLLLLDPVHEVDEGGWPYALPKEPTADRPSWNLD